MENVVSGALPVKTIVLRVGQPVCPAEVAKLCCGRRHNKCHIAIDISADGW